MKGFGLRLENLREESGYSQKQISKLLGYTDNVYGQYEREERSPSPETLVKLAELFNSSPNELILGTKNDGKHYKSFEKLINIFAQHGILDPYVLQIDKWADLDEEAFMELTNHFQWVYEKARNRD